MYRTDNSLLLGDALAATVAVRTLTLLGASFEVLPEKLAGHPALRGRNVMRFGSLSDSHEVALDLSQQLFQSATILPFQTRWSQIRRPVLLALKFFAPNAAPMVIRTPC